jgi:TetR/AcrR family fatty acid metabolism transcriptional regulator
MAAPPPEVTRDRADKHELILDAAIRVFAEKGFNAARISDVADAAGVADGTIYLYFKNKEDLLLSIFEEKMDLLLAGLREALVGVSEPLEQVRTFANYHFRQVQDHRELAEVLQIELRLSNKFLKEYRPEKLWEYLAIFAEIVRNGQERGVIRPDVDPFMTMWAFFGAMDEMSMQFILAKHRKFSLAAAADTVASIFIRGLSIPEGPGHTSEEA